MAAIEREAAGGILRDEEGVLIVPAPRGPAVGALRVVGPGRRERELVGDLSETRACLEAARDERDSCLAQLGAAALIERGTERLLDRVEAELERERREGARLREAQARLVLALGAVQRENAHLAGRVVALASGERSALRVPRWAFWRRGPRA